jgi:hypothetical protein
VGQPKEQKWVSFLPVIANWVYSTWGFMRQVFPLVFGCVIVAGFLLGRLGHPALPTLPGMMCGGIAG